MGWITVEKIRSVVGYQKEHKEGEPDAILGKQIAKLDLQVATAADLPNIGDEVEGSIVAAGSTAQIVEADVLTFVTLSGASGEWWPRHSSVIEEPEQDGEQDAELL